MATHTNILAWRIPLTEEPGGLQSMGLQGEAWLKWLSMHTHMWITGTNDQNSWIFRVSLFQTLDSFDRPSWLGSIPLKVWDPQRDGRFLGANSRIPQQKSQRTLIYWLFLPEGFPDSSVGKESICNTRDPCLIPGSGRSTGEGIDYPVQYSWACLVAELVKNLPAMQETWFWFLGQEHPLEKEMALFHWTLQYSCLENSMDRGAWRGTVHGVEKHWTRLNN